MRNRISFIFQHFLVATLKKIVAICLFFEIEGAKACAFDESKQRLYVTTGKHLVVIDSKKVLNKKFEHLDLM